MAASTSLKRGNATFSSPSGALSVIPLSISSPPPFPLVALTPLPLPGPFTPLSPLTPFKLTLTSPLKLELEEDEEEVFAARAFRCCCCAYRLAFSPLAATTRSVLVTMRATALLPAAACLLSSAAAQDKLKISMVPPVH